MSHPTPPPPHTPRSSDGSSVGWLLVGHGTREAAGQADFFAAASGVIRAVHPTPVQPCFLELAEPTIAQAMEALAGRGVHHVVVVPLLLFAAGHAKDDIPREAAHHAARLGLAITQADVLSCHEELLRLSAIRFHAAALAEGIATDQTATNIHWTLIGRGSRDDEALADVARFAELRQRITPVAASNIGFMALAEPRLDEVLEQAAESAPPVVVVQPHLLFQGELLARLRARVDDVRRQYPHKRWIVTERLGPHRRLIAAIVDQGRSAVTAAVDV